MQSTNINNRANVHNLANDQCVGIRAPQDNLLNLITFLGPIGSLIFLGDVYPSPPGESIAE